MPTQKEIEDALIDGHWRYGGLIHQKGAEALLAALRDQPSDKATGHALFCRLFGEYVAAIETHGAWAWALRNRFEKGSFLDAYLEYTNRDVHEFYALVREDDGDLSDLLRLPPAEHIAAAEELSSALATVEGFTEGFEARYKRLKLAAELYFKDERVLTLAYNKTKHGAPMVRVLNPENFRQFELVVLDRAKSGDDRYKLAKFTVSKTTIETLEANIASMMTSIRELAGLTRLLNMAGLLYERPAA